MTLHFVKRLLQRERLGNLRQLDFVENVVDFSSNDFLGLARSSLITESVVENFQTNARTLNGFGSTGSRLLTGNSDYAQELEKKIAKFHRYESAVLFNCGYMANVGLLSTVASHADSIIYDAAVHASTRDGIILSRAKAFPFKHNDLDHLENRLKSMHQAGNIFICVESIYSTDGSQAPLVEIAQLAKRYHAYLIVDEAHAVGVCGPEGRGLVAEYNLNSQIYAQVVTFGKALGTFGAAVLGSYQLKHAIINFATPYVYTTALPQISLLAINRSYDLFPKLNNERKHLLKLTSRFRKLFATSSTTHIQSLPMRSNDMAKQVSKELLHFGYDVRPLLSPTVQRGNELLRVCLHAHNSDEEIENLHKIHSKHLTTRKT